jgi:hypothetical protein
VPSLDTATARALVFAFAITAEDDGALDGEDGGTPATEGVGETAGDIACATGVVPAVSGAVALDEPPPPPHATRTSAADSANADFG